ncbi:MAG: hypothetical protein ABIF87_07200 [Pseudomonadota bacterium]
MKEFNNFIDVEDFTELDDLYWRDLQSYAQGKDKIADDETLLEWGDDVPSHYLNEDQ